MKSSGRLVWVVLGAVIGGVVAALTVGPPQPARAADDRYDDYILCTGACTVNPRIPTDGVWLLDYRAGKLLGTVIDRQAGKISGWAEVDLVSEFDVPPRKDVHFLMTTGVVAQGQAALYVAETTSGKFAVYTMGMRPDGQPGVMIKRNDMVMFRPEKGK